MADVALLDSEVAATPTGYTVPGAQEIIIKSITASYDGTSAVGPFVPTLQIIAPNGAVLASCPVGVTVAAGGSADVSWFPRGGIGTDRGIKYDTLNVGDWLDVETTASEPHSSFGQVFHAVNAGIDFFSSDATPGGSAAINMAVAGDNNQGLQQVVSGDGNGGWLAEVDDTTTAPAAIIAPGGAPIRALSGASGSFPSSLLTVNSFQVRAGNETDGGAIELETFATGAQTGYTAILMGRFGFPPNAPSLIATGTAVEVGDDCGFYVVDEHANIRLFVGHDQVITMPTLPTVNPGGAGKLWNNSGVVNIT
jgi:hypothetical protein